MTGPLVSHYGLDATKKASNHKSTNTSFHISDEVLILQWSAFKKTIFFSLIELQNSLLTSVNCTSVLGEQCFSPYTPPQLTIIVQCSPDGRLTNIIQAVILGFFGVIILLSLCQSLLGRATLVGGFASFFRVVSINNYSEILRNSFLPLYVRRQRVIIHFPKREL